jgi:hypothetical protein
MPELKVRGAIVDAEIKGSMSATNRLAGLRRLAGLAIATGDTEVVALVQELIDAERAQDGTIPSSLITGRDARDHEFRQAALAFPGKPVTKLHAEFSRYLTDVWPRDRLLDEMPPRHAGTLKAHFFRAMKAHPRAPGRRQLCNIISGNDRDVQIASEVGDDHGSEGGMI